MKRRRGNTGDSFRLFVFSYQSQTVFRRFSITSHLYVLKEIIDITHQVQTIVDYGRVFEDVQHQDGVAAREVVHVVLIDLLVDEQDVFDILIADALPMSRTAAVTIESLAQASPQSRTGPPPVWSGLGAWRGRCLPPGFQSRVQQTHAKVKARLHLSLKQKPLRTQAQRDNLTGLYNWRHLGQNPGKPAQTGQHLLVLMADVDRLKELGLVWSALIEEPGILDDMAATNSLVFITGSWVASDPAPVGGKEPEHGFFLPGGAESGICLLRFGVPLITHGPDG